MRIVELVDGGREDVEEDPEAEGSKEGGGAEGGRAEVGEMKTTFGRTTEQRSEFSFRSRRRARMKAHPLI